MGIGKLEIVDAHTHFFSYTWMQRFVELAKDDALTVDRLAQKMNWDCPPKDPAELGKNWVAEQEKFGLSRQILFASGLEEAEFLAAAINTFPSRISGFFMANPKLKLARNQAMYSFNALGMKGVLLFPALHHYNVNSKEAYEVYEEALAADAIVFTHFGQLKIPIFQKLGIEDNIDLRYSNPLDLKQAAHDFSEVNFVIPHFGCGRFEEALELASEFPNIFFDTSSSNAWIQPPLTLLEVFEKSLKTVGAHRLLFGTDSSFFPRGWRNDIFDKQLLILKQLQVSDQDIQAIMSKNINHLLRTNE